MLNKETASIDFAVAERRVIHRSQFADHIIGRKNSDGCLIARRAGGENAHLALEHKINFTTLVTLSKNDFLATVFFQTQILYNSFDLFFWKISKQRHSV